MTAHKEQVRKDRASNQARKVYEERTLCRRWMDDLVDVVEEELEEEPASMVRDMEGRKFFGKMLTSIKVEGNEGFGFRFAVEGAKVKVRPLMKFLRKRKEVSNPSEEEEATETPTKPPWQEKEGTVHGGPQYRPEQQDVAVGLGYLYRWLDLNNSSEHDVTEGAARIVLELKEAGFSDKILSRILKRAQAESYSA